MNEYFPTSTTVHPFSSMDSDGVETFAASYSSKARIESRDFLATNASGEAAQIDGIAYLLPGGVCPPGSKVVVGSDTYRVYSSRSHTDLDGYESHKKLLLTRLES